MVRKPPGAADLVRLDIRQFVTPQAGVISKAKCDSQGRYGFAEMVDDRARDWMWSQACELLARAERLQQEFFRPGEPRGALPVWQPPADILETDSEVLVLVALPGVAANQVEAAIDDGSLVIAASRVLPPALRTATIHRLELPQGRFHRRLPLPPGRYSSVTRDAVDGCLVITLRKAGALRG
jgi:HSP20 family protein